MLIKCYVNNRKTVGQLMSGSKSLIFSDLAGLNLMWTRIKRSPQQSYSRQKLLTMFDATIAAVARAMVQPESSTLEDMLSQVSSIYSAIEVQFSQPSTTSISEIEETSEASEDEPLEEETPPPPPKKKAKEGAKKTSPKKPKKA